LPSFLLGTLLALFEIFVGRPIGRTGQSFSMFAQWYFDMSIIFVVHHSPSPVTWLATSNRGSRQDGQLAGIHGSDIVGSALVLVEPLLPLLGDRRLPGLMSVFSHLVPNRRSSRPSRRNSVIIRNPSPLMMEPGIQEFFGGHHAVRVPREFPGPLDTKIRSLVRPAAILGH
jgi:hypothetical protein